MRDKAPNTRAIGRVLVANRGEIALRIIRACREEGLEAIAIYSDADRLAPFVRAADAAVRIGTSPPSDSYLVIDRIVAAALDTGADAVHPGFGFLSERAAFAEAVTGAGLAFVGPSATAIRAMGDKTEARRRMQAAGVPVVPGAMTALGSVEDAKSVASEIGYPVLVKAAAGGGGKGMRVVTSADGLASAITAAANEAQRAFGDNSLYLEKYIERPRHVEIQILADHERTIALGERECSIQRRHQKLVEETPSVAMTDDIRARMSKAAVAAARAVEYRSAGTCEFLLDRSGAFYFLEMNTRIQVEHPVTELVYGVDLVREQLRIARGLTMTVPDQPAPRGWAIECRITSENPANAFLPSTGQIQYLRVPGGPGVRWDSGVETGDHVTLFYDSMIAKLIVHAADRPQAIRRMQRALRELMVVGIATNQSFHLRLLADPDFQAGNIDIQFLERRTDLLSAEPPDELITRLAIATALAEDERRRRQQPAVSADGDGTSAWLDTARLEGLR